MTTLALPPPTGPRPGARGPAFGLGLSLLVHAAALAWLTRMPAPRPADQAPLARMQVRLAPPRPAQPALPDTAEVPAVPAAAPAARPAQSTPRRQPRAHPPAHAPARASEAPAVLSAPAAGGESGFTVPPPAAPDAATGPTVDLAAARQAAREIARADGKNLVALPKRKPVVDPNADHQVDDPLERARRSDCKTAYAGMGLLALIPLAKDAITGSGCKW
jgi:hypothetical protein